MNFTVSFSSRDPMNSTVANDATGQLLLQVETPFKIGKSSTTVRDAEGRVVGEYNRRWGHDQVSYRGETMRASEWLKKKTCFSSSRSFVAPNGRVYEWKSRWNSTFRLIDTLTNAEVAETHHASLGVFSKARHAGIEMRPDLAPFLDAVVLSFIICEKERSDEEAAAAAS